MSDGNSEQDIQGEMEYEEANRAYVSQFTPDEQAELARSGVPLRLSREAVKEYKALGLSFQYETPEGKENFLKIVREAHARTPLQKLQEGLTNIPQQISRVRDLARTALRIGIDAMYQPLSERPSTLQTSQSPTRQPQPPTTPGSNPSGTTGK